MPLYDYRCRACSEVTEVRHGFREAYQGTCPACGSDQLARVFNPAGIVFKGSGFYLTDSRKQAEAKASAGKSPEGKSPDGKSTDGKSSDGAAAASPAPAAASSDAGSKKSDASAA
jgi:putative FmdB family regulatory protein